MRPNTRQGPADYDSISQASGAYVGKRSTNRPMRQMSAQSKTIKLTPNARTFYPEGYYKRVGYQKSDAQSSSNARVDALGQRVRDRFNEEHADVVSNTRVSGTGGLHQRTLHQLKSAHNKMNGPASQISRGSDVFSQNKRRSMGLAAGITSRHNLDNVSVKQADDVQSVITLDRLKKFNDIQGTVAGNVLDEIAARE